MKNFRELIPCEYSASDEISGVPHNKFSNESLDL